MSGTLASVPPNNPPERPLAGTAAQTVETQPPPDGPSRASRLIIVGAAILVDGRVLGCERAAPPEVAGRWEFPGGKVEPGELELDALVRECHEELGVEIEVGERIGPDVPLAHGRAVLRVWLARLVAGEPRPLEHSTLRWLARDELDSVHWLPADAPIVAELARHLADPTSC